MTAGTRRAISVASCSAPLRIGSGRPPFAATAVCASATRSGENSAGSDADRYATSTSQPRTAAARRAAASTSPASACRSSGSWCRRSATSSARCAMTVGSPGATLRVPTVPRPPYCPAIRSTAVVTSAAAGGGVLTAIHRRRARVPCGAGHPDRETADAVGAGDSGDRIPLVFEHRPLLDVQLDVGDDVGETIAGRAASGRSRRERGEDLSAERPAGLRRHRNSSVARRARDRRAAEAAAAECERPSSSAQSTRASRCRSSHGASALARSSSSAATTPRRRRATHRR